LETQPEASVTVSV
jgi:hypothetical protein